MSWIAYLGEAVVVHLIDWTLGGLAGWFIGGGGKGTSLGLVLVVLYGMAIAGMILGDGMSDYFGPVTASIAFALMFCFGLRRLRGSGRKQPQTTPNKSRDQ